MKNIKILQSNKVCKDFYGGVFFVKEREQNNLLEYKGKSWMSMPLMEKGGVFTEPVFSPSHLHGMSIKTYHWPFSFLKKMQMLVHIHQLLYVQ